MRPSVKSAVLVSGQLACIILLAITGPVFPDNRIAWVLYALGWLVFFLGLKALSQSTITVFPEPAPGARLITTGIYRYVRHPFYSAVLLVAIALVINHFSVVRLLVWFCLLAVLVIKLQYEESLLMKQFPEYISYKKKSWRLIPQLY